jgi:hypothetical protein
MGWGLILLAAPDAVLHSCRTTATPAVRLATRILGARHVAEAALLGGFRQGIPGPWTVIIDLAHGSSMVALACVSRPLRRAALLSATITAGMAAVALRERGRRFP